MKQLLLLLTLCIAITTRGNALVITEIFSNPLGDDSGREWIEVYNETDGEIDISQMSFSIKGGTPVVATMVSGGTTLPSKSYAVIGSTVNGATKFLQDYPTYSGPLFKATMSLVNTGVTSLDVRLSGVVVDTVSSYAAAKENFSYSKQVSGSFAVVNPTPGKENSAVISQETTEASTQSTSGTQTTIPQMSPPAADIVIYLPQEKTVVAGAPTLFSVSALTQSGKAIDNIRFNWTFGDGGQGTGSSTVYSYFYPGRYIAYVDATNGLVAGKARMIVKVVAPELTISPIKTSKRGLYLEIHNPNTYELDISTWKLSINGSQYVLPLNTVLLPGVTSMSGAALGFASTSFDTTASVRLLFPNNEEVTRSVTQHEEGNNSNKKSEVVVSNTVAVPSFQPPVQVPTRKSVSAKAGATATLSTYTSTTTVAISKKDRRIAEFFRSFFK